MEAVVWARYALLALRSRPLSQTLTSRRAESRRLDANTPVEAEALTRVRRAPVAKSRPVVAAAAERPVAE